MERKKFFQAKNDIIKKNQKKFDKPYLMMLIHFAYIIWEPSHRGLCGGWSHGQYRYVTCGSDRQFSFFDMGVESRFV
jgi:hypothetical protein